MLGVCLIILGSKMLPTNTVILESFPSHINIKVQISNLHEPFSPYVIVPGKSMECDPALGRFSVICASRYSTLFVPTSIHRKIKIYDFLKYKKLYFSITSLCFGALDKRKHMYILQRPHARLGLVTSPKININ